MVETGRAGRRETRAPDEAELSERLTGARRLKLRTVLLIVVFVPSLTFAPLLASGMHQLYGQWRTEIAQMDLATTVAGGPTAELFFALNQERRLTAEVLGDPQSAARGQLTEQRAVTDQAVAAFRPLTGLDVPDAQEGFGEALAGVGTGLGRLDEQRRAVDSGRAGPQRTFDYYSELLESSLAVLTVLARTDEGQVNREAQTLVDLFWVVYLIGREDAILARGWETGRLTRNEHGLVTDAIGARDHLVHSRVVPALKGDETPYKKITEGEGWEAMSALEGQLSAGALGDDGVEWRSSVEAVTGELRQLLDLRFQNVTKIGYDHARMVFTVFVSISSVGLLALGLVIFTSWRLTAILRRRIAHLRHEAQGLQERLSDVVARLERGEDVDVDAEVRLLKPTPDELGELGQALNQASRSAVRTAVRQAEQHRGFQRMLQRIARRTQILIGLQLKKLDELERRHEDPEVLEGLFDLDHLTARLRRYEENLVILGGGQPQRRWRRPVQLLDVLRAAQGEVQDYRRISIDVDGEFWIAERAVGPLAHVLAELMENATAFSKPETPVEVRAAAVSRGVAVEVEDRGLGMEPEEYAAANELLRSPPRLDVMTHADDVRLGLYVVARLSAGLGLKVELRASAFGGTRVIVLVPESLVVDRPRPAATPDARPRQEPAARPRQEGELPARTPATADASPSSGQRPLPRRVRQASLAPELRLPAGDERTEFAVRDRPARSGATIGAFQRQSRRRRAGDDAEPSSPTTEDR
ncbi:nitrate- and nitrite sensing domain-containing protein [Nonomuraea sp. NPDC049649]|uniref:sensor histidine kinase n=1 Tax=Nonomuraea sp. NPDC049649 TaxID=3155776 RepID=UPI003418D098